MRMTSDLVMNENGCVNKLIFCQLNFKQYSKLQVLLECHQ